jgi:hypothetical protein
VLAVVDDGNDAGLLCPDTRVGEPAAWPIVAWDHEMRNVGPSARFRNIL